ncbi:MAG: hypothetical protein QNI84_08030 [Henriciella sp.]|nr:hypothetical protein [Henriciella sp.]
MRDLSEAVKACLLEGAVEASLLQALATYTDRRTLFSAVSRATLSGVARYENRTLSRAFERLCGAASDQLLVIPRRPKGGPGVIWTYRVHWERIQIVAGAVATARRRIGGGATRAIRAGGHLGAPASEAACSGVIHSLRAALLAEDQRAAARGMDKALNALSEAMTGWPERVCGQVTPNYDFETTNYDSETANLDFETTPPTPPYKDILLKDNPLTRTPMREAALDVRSLAGLSRLNGQRRADLAERLLGCHLATLDGWLVIRAGSTKQCDQLNRTDFNTLLSVAMDHGYLGLMITDRGRHAHGAKPLPEASQHSVSEPVFKREER